MEPTEATAGAVSIVVSVMGTTSIAAALSGTPRDVLTARFCRTAG
jgi:hypothetical protein